MTAALPFAAPATQAQTPAEFYKGRTTIEVGISSTVGGGYDAHARMLARHPELLADARKARLEILPVSGAEVQKLVAELYATPAPVVETASEMLK